jgi:hypothetical protein
MARRVKVGAQYVYRPVPFDQFDTRANIDLAPGDIVTVINLPGAPPANTMGMCYVAIGGVFARMVMTNSLTPVRARR